MTNRMVGRIAVLLAALPIAVPAAGMLGAKQTPPPLGPGRLEQSLVWDGKDDLGRAVLGERNGSRRSLKVRVRAGMGATLDGFVGENRHHVGGFFGMATDDGGNLYILSASTGGKGPDGTRYMQVFGRKGRYLQTISGDCVVAFDATGEAENPGRMKGDERFRKHGLWDGALIGPIASPIGNVAVDGSGCLYLAVRGLPADYRPPPGFEKDPAYNAIVGSAIKFRPEGGAVTLLGGPAARPPLKARPIPEGKQGITISRRMGYPRGPMFVENAVAAYPGIASMSGSFGSTGCRCRQPMFHLDGFGRLFIPNALTSSVRIVDNAGNEIATLGAYGNADSRGPGADGLVKTPAIPLGWPEAVGASNKAIYIADVLKPHRSIREDLAGRGGCRVPVRAPPRTPHGGISTTAAGKGSALAALVPSLRWPERLVRHSRKRREPGGCGVPPPGVPPGRS